MILATGEKWKYEQDIVAHGLNALSLGRTYRSFATTGRLFGTKWFSTYDYPNLKTSGCFYSPDYPGTCLPTTVIFTQPDGASYSYTRVVGDDGAYRAKNSEAGGTLQFGGSSWTLMKDGITYSYSSSKAIQNIKSSSGATLLQFTYGTGGTLNRPIRVTNAAGQFIEFTYAGNGGLLSKAKDSAGNEWNYTYNANYMLATVTAPGPNPDVRTYHYENAADPTLLTGISINGVRYSTYKYFANKRVQESGLAGGEELDTFSYTVNQTTVTSAAGQPVTYNFSSIQGALKVSSVSRAATTTCASASSVTAYDANGWVDYTLDWNGNKTDYSFDAAGKLLQVVTAAGTPSAATRVNTWSGSNLIEERFLDASGTAYARVAYTYTSGQAADRLASETWSDLRLGGSRTTSYAYTFHANKQLASKTVTRTLPSSTAVTTYVYDTSGNLSSVTNPLGHVVSPGPATTAWG